MKVIGFGLEKISSEKKNSIKDKLEISANTEIKEITEEKVEALKEVSLLKLTFEFKLEYKPDIANIEIGGYVLISTEKKEAKEILKKWKSKELDDEMRLNVLNFIISKTSLKALQIEEDLELPFHMPFPRVMKKKEDKA